MGKQRKHKKQIRQVDQAPEPPNWFQRFLAKAQKVLVAIYRFFVPKDWKGELIRGQIIGEQMRQGKISPRVVPTYWLGKGARKLIDPKHKMKFGKEKENENGQEK